MNKLAKEVLSIYTQRMIPRASAALSFYLTMTIFPLIICLYALFGQSYRVAMRVYSYVEQYFNSSATELIKSFLLQVVGRSSEKVIVTAITMLVIYASATIRVLLGTISEIQGKHRFRAIPDFFISFALSAALVFAVFFSIVVLLTGHQCLHWIQTTFSITINDASWLWLRFVLLGSIALMLIWGIFLFVRPRDDHYRVLPGAIFSTAGIVVMSKFFSALIESSARYSLVYGSLASLILVMFWMYLMCQAIFIGAALNIALRDRR